MLKLRKFLSCTLALLLICGLPVSAFADTWYLENGDITVNAMESGQTVTQGEQVDVPDSAPVITQSDSSTPTDNTITINADAGATANVTIQDVNIVISDPAGSTQNHSGDAAVTIDVANGAQANVTLDGVNIDTRNTGSVSQNQYGDPVYNSGEAAVQITGNGDVTLELDGENTVKSGNNRAGVEKNTTDSSGKGNLTITDETGKDGSLNATGGVDGAGIGGAQAKDSSNITITGSAEVTATGGFSGAGIGGGRQSTGSSDITVSGDAQVKAQGGKDVQVGNAFTGAGAAIGEGGQWENNTVVEVTPDTDALNEGWVATYAPGTTNLDTAVPNSLTYQGASGVANAKPIVKLEPTCTEAGHKAGFMDGNTQVGGQTLPATGHSFTTYVSNNNPTCTTNCTETANCDHSDCTATDTRDIADTAWGHKFTNYIYDDNATCTEDGSKTAQCDHGCGLKDTVTDTGSALGHSFTNYISDGNATYDQDGTKTAKCDRCDETDTLPDPGSKLVKPAESVTVSPKLAAVVEYSGMDESAFWQEVARQIEAAAPGDTIEVNAGGICTIPYWVIDAAVEHGVALSIHWRCGEDFIIDRKPDQQLWVYSFTTLPQLLGN